HSFFFHPPPAHPALHSFPTRRSSDLVDVGGTFTDLVALAQDGTIEVRKVVTTPDDPTVGLFRALDPLKTPHAIELLVHGTTIARSEEHTSELQSRFDLVCRLLLEKKK